MRLILAALAVLYVICRIHVTIWLYGTPVATVSAGALLLAATLTACGAAVVLMVLKLRAGPHSCPYARPVATGGAR